MVKGMHAFRVALTIVLIAASAAVIGSGIAAIPYWENEPCISYLSETGPQLTWVTQFAPYGTRCEPVGGGEALRLLAPSTGEWVAWMLVIAAVLALAWGFRRHASARGVALAAAVLGLFGLLAHQGDGALPLMAAVVLGAPLVLLGDRMLRPEPRWATSVALCLSLPFVVMAVWFVPGFMAYEELAAALALLAGAGTAAVVERAPIAQWWHPGLESSRARDA